MSDAVCMCGHGSMSHGLINRRCTVIVSRNGMPDRCLCRVFVESKPAHDVINKPAHYTWHPDGIQPIQLMEHLTYNAGAACKYLMRAGRKGDAIEDLKKARFHVEREIARLEKERNK